MNLNSSFYYPVTLHDNLNVSSLRAPVVEDLPVLPDVPVVILPHDRGNRSQGLYAYKGRCWYLVLPMYEVSQSIIRGDVLNVYANLSTAQPVPSTSFLWANGGRMPSNEMVPGPLLYLVQTPPAQGGGGGGDVTSVNGQVGDVLLNANNLPGLSAVGKSNDYNDLDNKPEPYVLPAATAASVGGVSVPAGSNLTVTAQGALSVAPALVTTINSKVGNVVSVGAGVSSIQSLISGSLSLRSLQGAGTVSVTEDGAGQIVITGTNTPYVLPVASAGVLGGVRIGAGLTINPTTGVLDAVAAPYTLPAATAGALGGIRVGTGLTIDGQGILSTLAYALPVATTTVLGGVKAGANVTIAGDGTLSVAGPYALPAATAGALGGIRVGSGLSIDGAGILSASGTSYTLPAATTSVLGGVIAGAGLAVTAGGVLSVVPAAPTIASAAALGSIRVGAGLAIDAGTGVLSATGSTYTLPAATAAALGGIRVGTNLTIDGQGILSAASYDLPTATTEDLGGVIVGAGLLISPEGVLSATGGDYTLPAATAAALGGVKIGANVNVTADGTLSVAAPYSLPVATTTTVGGVQVGSGLAINGAGVLSATTYTLPVATAAVLGGVKAGANVTIAGDGTLSVAAPYTLPAATTTARGGITVGAGLAVDDAGVLSATGGDYTLPAATAAALGGVSVPAGSNLAVTAQGALSVAPSLVTSINGKIGTTADVGAGISLVEAVANSVLTLRTLSGADGVSIIEDEGDIIIIGSGAYTLPIATAGSLGGIRIGTGLSINSTTGVVSATATPYTLPTASAATLGGVRVGSGLSIDDAGILSASEGEVASFNTRTGAVILTSADVTTALTYTPLNKAGDSLTGALNEAPAAALAAAATTDISSIRSNTVRVSGNATITSLGTAVAGAVRRVQFLGTPILTHGGSAIVLPANTNIQVASEDWAEFVGLSNGAWACSNYMRKNGTPLAGGGTAYTAGTGLTLTGNAFSITPSGAVAGTYSKVTVNASGQVTTGAQLNPADITTALGYSPLNSAGGTSTGTQVLAGSVTQVAAKLRNAVEQILIGPLAPNGTIAHSLSDGAVLYTPIAATGPWTLNIRHSSTTALNAALAVGDAVTVTHLATQGSNPQLLSGLSVDGTVQTINWQGSAPTGGNANAIDAYVFTIIKTANAVFTVLGTQSKFGG